MRVLSSNEWGSDTTTLLQVYRTLIRFKLDYACFIYGSAKKKAFGMLDSIHHQGLRLSPVESLNAEADEPPLALGRKQLALQYASKIEAHPKNPEHTHAHAKDRKLKIHTLLRMEKAITDPQTFKQTFSAITETYADQTFIYTDGEKATMP